MLLYARIKGVDEARLAAVANEKMQQMDLTLFRSVKVCLSLLSAAVIGLDSSRLYALLYVLYVMS